MSLAECCEQCKGPCEAWTSTLHLDQPGPPSKPGPDITTSTPGALAGTTLAPTSPTMGTSSTTPAISAGEGYNSEQDLPTYGNGPEVVLTPAPTSIPNGSSVATPAPTCGCPTPAPNSTTTAMPLPDSSTSPLPLPTTSHVGHHDNA